MLSTMLFYVLFLQRAESSVFYNLCTKSNAGIRAWVIFERDVFHFLTLLACLLCGKDSDKVFHECVNGAHNYQKSVNSFRIIVWSVFSIPKSYVI